MFDFKYPTPLPSTKGWGPGYPDCQRDKIVPDPIFQGGVHQRIDRLVELLTIELQARGYVFRDGWSWGFGCRGTKSSSGSQGVTPSFHSWGLGLDFNAPLNVFGADRANTQLGKPEFNWVVDFMRSYGFFWLGPSIGDWMHFSFCGSPEDADRMTAKAEAEIGDNDVKFEEWYEGVAAYKAGESEPGTPGWKRKGWLDAKQFLTKPKPAAHDHPHKHDVPGGKTGDPVAV